MYKGPGDEFHPEIQKMYDANDIVGLAVKAEKAICRIAGLEGESDEIETLREQNKQLTIDLEVVRARLDDLVESGQKYIQQLKSELT